MATLLLVGAVVIVACIFCKRISDKLGMPMLFAFIGLGMLFGSDGIYKLRMDDLVFAENICLFSLVFIMFYGGFGTKWQEAKPVALKAALLSSIGVILTAGLTGLFCHFVLKFDLLESLLIGSVLSSTDAASVFSILRYKKLNLKYGTASMLEVESGSNDPFAYMLTVVILSVMSSQSQTGSVGWLIFTQVVYGVLFGFLIAFAALRFLKNFKFEIPGFNAVFVFAIALFAYAVPELLHGNGFLSTYIVGIILGNSKIKDKRSLVHFFDGFTGLMQMLIFFLLGLLALPSQMPMILVPAVLIALFLTFAARPLVVGLLLTPFKCKFNQQALVSWTGLRGAASIVFAVMVNVSDAYTKDDVFHIVFCVVLFSIAFQGSLLPFVAKKLKMIDEHGNVLKTFNDYSLEHEVQFISLSINNTHPWLNQCIKDIVLPPETLLAMIQRGEKIVVPKGDTEILEGDKVILSAAGYHDDSYIHLSEITIDEEHRWCNKSISRISTSKDTLILMIIREGKTVIPNGNVDILKDDILVLYSTM